jgi:hypothetical protein
MGDTPDLKENIIVQILKYRPVKYLIVGLLALLVWSGLYHFYRCHLGLNSEFLWGASKCEECKQVTIDSITKHDTLTVYKAIPASKESSGKPTITQTNKNGENKANVNTGTNNGIIGDNGTINKETVFSDSEKQRLLKKIDNLITTYPTAGLRIRICEASQSPKATQEMESVLQSKYPQLMPTELANGLGCSGIDASYNDQEKVIIIQIGSPYGSVK